MQMDIPAHESRVAIERLFELTVLGQTGGREYERLDHLVHEWLVDAYRNPAPPASVTA